MTITFVDKTVNPLFTATKTPGPGTPLKAFNAVTVADTGALTATEDVVILLNASGSTLLNNSDLGTITDPNGGGLFTPSNVNAAFVESGLIGGDPTFATTLLSRLDYNPPALANGQSAEVKADIFAQSTPPGFTTDPTTIIIDSVTAPAITGTVANQPLAFSDGSGIRPFATALITDADFNLSGKDTLAVTVTDGGTPTDADGLLTSFSGGLSKTGVGTYSIGNPDNPINITSLLRDLFFTPTTVAGDTTRTTAFELDATDVGAKLTSKDTTTSVMVIGPPSMPKPPTIAGTQAGQTVITGNTLKPFSAVTISDSTSAQDSVAITVTDSTGKAGDANGKLSGTGLTETSPGVYALAAATPATITSEIDALTFAPIALSGTTPLTTGMAIDATNVTNKLTATDKTTTVIENPSQISPPTSNFTVSDQTTGLISNSAGDPYPGPVAGINREIILATPDNINVTAHIPNVFIRTGSGEDAIDVSATNGKNILDGSTGSNFLFGGTGPDTFFVDNRNAPASIWSTVKGFHSGDDATIFGVTKADFKIQFLDGLGAVGNTGLTVDFTAAGKPDARMTLVGFTTTDLTNGKLTTSFGTETDGTTFMVIHAN